MDSLPLVRLPVIVANLAIAVVLAVQVAPADAQGPDFAVVSIVADPVVPPPHQSVNITVTVENLGDWCVGCFPFSVDFYKNRATAPPAGASGDFACQVNPPAPGATTTCSGTVSYSAEGSYPMWARVDTYNSVGEADESNNLFGPQSITVAYPPDLRVESMQVVPASPLAGQPADVTVTIRNDGRTCVLCSTASVDFYSARISQPGPFNAGDFACSVNPPASGETASCLGVITYPYPGTFQAWAQVDRLNQVYEWSDANNLAGPQSITVRPDADGDGTEDSLDNCPYWPNPSQNTPDWFIPAGDSDCDNFTDSAEVFSGTEPTLHCASTSVRNDEAGPDRWPSDFDDNQIVNIIDVSTFSSHYGSVGPNPPYDKRWDFNSDNKVNIIDVSKMSQTYGKNCT